MPIIDVHTHLFPPSARKAAARGSHWYGASVEMDGDRLLVVAAGRRRPVQMRHLQTIDERLATMDRLGVDIEVLSPLPSLLGYELPIPDGIARAHAVNDDIATWIHERPERFMGLGVVAATDPDAAIAEMERVLAIKGFVGVILGTNVDGRNWDDDRLFPILAAAERLEGLVFLHPQDVRGGDDDLFGRYYLRNGLGNPLETTAAAASLIFGRVLDRLPRLRVCLAHGGGYLASAVGRLDHIWHVRKEAAATSARPPTEYLRRFFVDALTHDQRAVRYLIDRHGADRVVFGTDFPADMSPADPVGQLRSNLWLTNEERTAILSGNLEREFRLDAQGGHAPGGSSSSAI